MSAFNGSPVGSPGISLASLMFEESNMLSRLLQSWPPGTAMAPMRPAIFTLSHNPGITACRPGMLGGQLSSLNNRSASVAADWVWLCWLLEWLLALQYLPGSFARRVTLARRLRATCKVSARSRASRSAWEAGSDGLRSVRQLNTVLSREPDLSGPETLSPSAPTWQHPDSP